MIQAPRVRSPPDLRRLDHQIRQAPVEDLAAVDATRRNPPPDIDVPWLIGTARHKLVDHWRRCAREQRDLAAVAEPITTTDPDEEHLDALRAHQTLDALGPHHRAALTPRYLDDLPVPQVATLGRTLHATEALLVRAGPRFCPPSA